MGGKHIIWRGIGAFLVVLFLVLTVRSWFGSSDEEESLLVPLPVEVETPTLVLPMPQSPVASITVPLDRSAERVTKKPFGILIDQTTSPVQPERFSGYHTGVDFETFSSEEMTDVPVRAICSGEIVVKRKASGYGGVLVTSCTLGGEEVTVVYGHLRLSSITGVVGATVSLGDEIGVLGTGGSSETDGERKHLHLGIHRGSTLNILGYVSDREDLGEWLDPCLFVCQ